MSLDKTVKCHICGAPYKFYAFSAADQSACPACVEEAERSMNRPSDEEMERRRFRRAGYFDRFRGSL